MSEWQFSFPQSRSCLWDGTPIGESTELFITRNGWIRVQLSVPALQLAVRYARQGARKPFHCFLIASPWINEGESIALEVDRFDPGRLLKGSDELVPTALIPGDVAIPCQVVVGSHPLAKHLTHNLVTLKEAFKQLGEHLKEHPCPLDPAPLLSLRVHCSCSKDGDLVVQCGCVSPAIVCEATPIKPIPIVKTALARNLSGPLPLTILQGRVRHGYITMDSTRKVLLVLHSDPKASQLPLVGVWVSGVGSVYHPQVWTACVSYTCSLSLSDRVWGENGSYLLLVYVQGATQPSCWQCTNQTGRDGLMGPKDVPFEIASGDTSIQPSSETASAMCVELFPAQESTALKTLLEAAVKSSIPENSMNRGSAVNLNEVSCDLPVPSPKPTPTLVPQRPSRDSELSMLSLLSIADNLSLTASQHDSVCLSHSTITSSSSSPLSLSVAPHIPPSTQTQCRETAAPLVRSIPCQNHHELPYSDKENVSPLQTDTKNAGTGDGSLIVFPEKQISASKSPLSSSSTSVPSPSPNTQELLRQQELQLRVLQEQVNSLLRSQSATNSPATQVGSPPTVATPPRVEAGTSTGQSLFWRPPSPPSSLPRDSITADAGSQYNGSSVCSSSMADLSVQTATSILSQGVSEMHLDLQSYANSPASSHSESFGDSASIVGLRKEEGSQESSPATLLFRDQRQFYQNMLAQVNDLIQSQQEKDTNLDADSSNCSNGTTPKCSPSPSLIQHSLQLQENASQERVHKGLADLTASDDNHSHCRQSQGHVSNLSKANYSRESLNHSCQQQSHQSEDDQPVAAVLKHPSMPPLLLGDVVDQSLPPLHPDVLQQQFAGGDVSLLPVPRIVYSGGSGGGTYRAMGTTFVSQLGFGGSDYTVDENTQMADMIALKYLGKKGELTRSNEIPGGVPVLDSDSGTTSDKTLAHMSMATRQYLEKHNLIRSPQAAGRLEEESGTTKLPCDGERILDVKRLKTLPKLI